MKKFVFFDRDGVINQQAGETQDRAPRNLKELTVYPDAILEIPKLAKHGFELIVITNQPDVARKKNSIENVIVINNSIKRIIPCLNRFTICPHDNIDNCYCRKPKPGMILDVLQNMVYNPFNCWLIGDRITDIRAGASAGIRTILLNRSSDSSNLNFNQTEPDYLVSNLQQATKIIISQDH